MSPLGLQRRRLGPPRLSVFLWPPDLSCAGDEPRAPPLLRAEEAAPGDLRWALLAVVPAPGRPCPASGLLRDLPSAEPRAVDAGAEREPAWLLKLRGSEPWPRGEREPLVVVDRKVLRAPDRGAKALDAAGRPSPSPNE